MIKFFELKQSESRYRNKSTSFGQLRKLVLTELDKLRYYYNTSNYSVNNNHVLAKLLISLNVSMKRDNDTYVEYVEDAAESLYKGLGITSSTESGEVFGEGVFYNKNITEVILAANEPFNVKEAYSNWRDLEPVRVLCHPFTDLSFDELDGNYRGSEEQGLAVILVNIPMLALQFKAWVSEERDAGGQTRRVQQFLYAYPLNNMQRSHVDLVFFNRLANRYYGIESAKFRRVIPKGVFDYTSRLDEEVEKTLDIITKGGITFTGIFLNIPAIVADNMLKRIQIPDILITSYIKGALFSGWFKYMKFMYDLDYDSDKDVNVDIKNEFRIILRGIYNYRYNGRHLPADYQQQIEIMRNKLGK